MQFSQTSPSASKSRTVVPPSPLQFLQGPSGSESDTYTDPTASSPHHSSSPEPVQVDDEPCAYLRQDIIRNIQSPTDFHLYPVSADGFWSLWNSPHLWPYIESRGFTYNSSALTLHIKSRSVGLHNVGWLWCSTGFDAMHDDRFIATKDLAQKARGAKKLLGLIMQVQNKSFASFDKDTPWKDMHRTPDWAIYRMSESRATDKPLVVMEVGLSQHLTRSAKSKSPKETLQERAEGWLLATMGITKAVVLIDLSKVKATADPFSVPELAHDAEQLDDLLSPRTSSINVTVQVWRLNPDTSQPVIDETHSFVVCEHSETWDDSEVPADFPKGITFRASDIYDRTSSETTFLLPLSWLRTAIIETWALHLDDADAEKEMNKSKTPVGASPVKKI